MKPIVLAGLSSLALAACAPARRAPDPAPAPVPAPVPATARPEGPTPVDSTVAPTAGLVREAQRNWHLLDPSTDRVPGIGAERALRELLALQSSDWAFLISNGTAGPYPLERFEGHLAALESENAPQLRNLCPVLG